MWTTVICLFHDISFSYFLCRLVILLLRNLQLPPRSKAHTCLLYVRSHLLSLWRSLKGWNHSGHMTNSALSGRTRAMLVPGWREQQRLRRKRRSSWSIKQPSLLLMLKGFLHFVLDLLKLNPSFSKVSEFMNFHCMVILTSIRFWFDYASFHRSILWFCPI